MKVDYTRKDVLYRNPWSRWTATKNRPDIIWREHNIDEEIERFKEVYERWCNKYPSRIELTGGKHPRERKAEEYIQNFLDNIEDIQNEAEELNWPWEWCIDDLSLDAKYFYPSRIVLGDSRQYRLYKNGMMPVSISQEKEKGKGCKKTTRMNNHYRCYCTYDQGETRRRSTSVSVEEFVCNYFRAKPIVTNEKLEAGHVFGFNPEYASIVNNNMLNVHWQTADDNKRIQRLFDNHNYKRVFELESEKSMAIRGIPTELGEPSPYRDNIHDLLAPDMEEMKKKGLEMGYEFIRDENGLLKKIWFVQDRLIVPVEK